MKTRIRYLLPFILAFILLAALFMSFSVMAGEVPGTSVGLAAPVYFQGSVEQAVARGIIPQEVSRLAEHQHEEMPVYSAVEARVEIQARTGMTNFTFYPWDGGSLGLTLSGALIPNVDRTFTFKYKPAPSSVYDGKEEVDFIFLKAPSGWTVQSISDAPAKTSSCVGLGVTQDFANPGTGNSLFGYTYWGVNKSPIQLTSTPPLTPTKSGCGPYALNTLYQPVATMHIPAQAKTCPGYYRLGLTYTDLGNPMSLSNAHPDSLIGIVRGDGKVKVLTTWYIIWYSPCPDDPKVDLIKTIGLHGAPIIESSDYLEVYSGTVVDYWYTIYNPSIAGQPNLDLELFTLVDDHLGTIAQDQTIAPVLNPGFLYILTPISKVITGEPGTCYENEATLNISTPIGYGQRQNDYDPEDPDGGQKSPFGMYRYYTSTHATAEVCIRLPETDLVITKKSDLEPLIAGEPITYTITLTNAGAEPAFDVSLVDIFPAGVGYSSHSTPVGNCQVVIPVQQRQDTPSLHCDFGTLQPGQVVKVYLYMIPEVTGAITNTVMVTGTLVDTQPLNNHFTLIDQVYQYDEDDDGVPTRLEWKRDSDVDGIPDYLDDDDDGDGVPTSEELGPGPLYRDADGDGIPDYLDNDDDSDGVPTKNELGTGGIYRDTDLDGLPDYLDNDDDDDGILTKNELGIGGVFKDTDSDGKPDHLDNDDDGDGVLTKNELGIGGIYRDTDGDGIYDHLDNDDDGDRVPTADELGSGPGYQDTDGDGKPDYLDPDDDNDGWLTKDEDWNKNNNPKDDDANHNSIPDYLDPLVPFKHYVPLIRR